MDLFSYVDYKKFFKDLIKLRPHKGRGEFARLADYLGINSTMVSQILSGPKDFTFEQAQRLCHYFALNKIETDYLMILVQIERAGSVDLKNYYREKRDEIKINSGHVSKRISPSKDLTEQEKSIFYSNYLYSSIHLYCSLPNGQSSESIERRFSIKRFKAQKILDFLVSARLCSQNTGRYTATSLTTHVSPDSADFLKHHSNWRLKSVQKCEDLNENDLFFTANISLSTQDYVQIRELLLDAISRTSKIVANSPPEELCNLNIDFFKI